MTRFVLVHGAFRVGEHWRFVADALVAAGHEVAAPTLTGDSLVGWARQVAAAIGAEPAVLVGHSQGGVVAQLAATLRPEAVSRLVLLDSPLLKAGQRMVDAIPEEVQQAWGGPPPPDSVLQPRPIEPEGELDAARAAWANSLLRPEPVAPAYEEVSAPPDVPTSIWFCSGTPAGVPAYYARLLSQEQGRDHLLIDSGHDAPLVAPSAVAKELLKLPAVR